MRLLEPRNCGRVFLPGKFLAYTSHGILCSAQFLLIACSRSPPSSFTWRGTWRSTYLNLPPSQIPNIDCSHLYSDSLHRPFYCAHISLDPYIRSIPARNKIARLPNLSPEEFHENWSDTPFILTEPVKEWPAYRQWTTESLLAN